LIEKDVKILKGKFSFERWLYLGKDFSKRRTRLYLKCYNEGRGNLRKEFVKSKKRSVI